MRGRRQPLRPITGPANLRTISYTALLYLAWTMWREKGMIALDRPSGETGAVH